MVEELVETYKEQAVIAACDVEENNDIAYWYSIRNIPTVIFFKDGKEVGRQVGAIARNILEE
jgi:thioredoxin 1